MKEKKDSGNQLVLGSISDVNRKMRMMEERIDNMRNHIELLENNIIEMNKSVSEELETFNKTFQELRNQMQENLEKFSRLSENINNLASKESVRVMEKYIELLNPMTLVTRDEVEDIIKEVTNKD
jgi:predicted  nucleic acid-binding Zn-ribbon protein